MKPPSKQEIDNMDPEELRKQLALFKKQSKLSEVAETTVQKKKTDTPDQKQINELLDFEI